MEAALHQSLCLLGEADKKLENIERVFKQEIRCVKEGQEDVEDAKAKLFADQVSILQNRNSALEAQVLELEKSLVLANRKVMRLENMIKDRENLELVRRYHFIESKDGLLSSVGGGDLWTPRSKVAPFFFEVRPLQGFSKQRTSLVEVASSSTTGCSRFSFTDHLLKKMQERKVEMVHMKKVADWLNQVDPRTHADATPMLALAKGIIMQLVEVCSEGKQHEEQTSLKKHYEGLLASKDLDIQADRAKYEKSLQQVRSECEQTLLEYRAKYYDQVLNDSTVRVTLLRFRNSALGRKLEHLNEQLEYLKSRSSLDLVKDLRDEESISALRALLETDRIIQDLPDDFVGSSAMSHFATVALCQQLLMTLEYRHSGRATWPQVLGNVFSISPTELLRKLSAWLQPLDADEPLPPLQHAESLAPLQHAERSTESLAPLQRAPGLAADCQLLAEFRDDLNSEKKDIWDIASLILKVLYARWLEKLFPARVAVAGSLSYSAPDSKGLEPPVFVLRGVAFISRCKLHSLHSCSRRGIGECPWVLGVGLTVCDR